MKDEKKSSKDKKTAASTPCESCEFYDQDEYGDFSCIMNLDEDEMVNVLGRNTGSCPYYRYYDEYKSVVHKQI